jgi:hypothetical protein
VLETTIKCNARQWTTKIRVHIMHSDMWEEPEVDICFSCSKYQSVVVAINPGFGRRRSRK